ncbi:magnesium and cobalt transport protein CorA [Reyranella sp. CPCC 100927]|uniref:magnesium and cobalt transport protein CorA n=1 Tax=Reyranella sp. CPCC 100927 TaxID=2599616 RepID=UPI0011B45642|nr:magnesium and cobalt transport protein CorA [Reyranella sp. CPCC 100927]TWT11461.1 magnesium and cobalt transport protein CorA [Reyranella sp. CPCC 100927]
MAQPALLPDDLGTPSEPGLIAAVVYAGGQKIRDIAIDHAREWAKRPGHFVWIGLHEPEPALLARVQAQFDLHPMAIEDAENAHQRPKLEQYGAAVFIVARTAQLVDDHVAFGETHLFVGRGYIVSVRHGASTSYTTVRQRLEACPTVLSHGEHYALYGILDFIVDSYMHVAEALHAKVDDIEDRVLTANLTRKDVEVVYDLRRDLLRLRNAAGPLVDVCRRLEHAEVLSIEPSMQPMFRDVTDHVRSVESEIDTLREVLAFAFEASIMWNQAEQNTTMRRLAAWAAILAVPTAIAGIYGMNFEHMPELKWEYGYFVVLGTITAVCGGLFAIFRRSKWL